MTTESTPLIVPSASRPTSSTSGSDGTGNSNNGRNHWLLTWWKTPLSASAVIGAMAVIFIVHSVWMSDLPPKRVFSEDWYGSSPAGDCVIYNQCDSTEYCSVDDKGVGTCVDKKEDGESCALEKEGNRALAGSVRIKNASVRIVPGLAFGQKSSCIATVEPVGKSSIMGSHAEMTTTARVIIVITFGGGRRTAANNHHLAIGNFHNPDPAQAPARWDRSLCLL